MTDQLTPEHIKSFLAKYENPADARKFLLKAGLIDESGNLAPPYRISLSPEVDVAEDDIDLFLAQ